MSKQTAITTTADITGLLAEWHEWLDRLVKSGDMAATTADNYKRGMDNFSMWRRANPGGDVDPVTLLDWKAVLLADGKRAATVNALLSGVKSFYSWAVSTGRTKYNPAREIRGAARKGTGHTRDALATWEVRRVLDAAKANPRDYAILALLAYTGVRSCEVNRANLGDLRTKGNRLVLYITGKGHRETDDFVVIANSEAQAALSDWIATRGKEPGPLFCSVSPHGRGERLTLRSLRRIVKHYYDVAGVTGNKTTHSLRHTAITQVALKKGIRAAQQMARHRSQATTEIYLHDAERLDDPGEDVISYDE